MSETSQLLQAAAAGDRQAAQQLLPLVYDELRRLAAAKLAQEKPGQTLDATALVHEAYLRLVGHGQGTGDREQGTEVGGQRSDVRSQEIGEPKLSPVSCSLSPGLWHSRGHFFAAAAEAMRRILVEAARRKMRIKHGGELRRQQLVEDDMELAAPVEELLAVHEALGKLEAANPQAATLVKLRYFAGFTIPQAADQLGISPRKANQVWAYARAFLAEEMAQTSGG